MSSVMAEERALRERDGEGSGHQQLEPGVAQKYYPAQNRAQRQKGRPDPDGVVPPSTVQKPRRFHSLGQLGVRTDLPLPHCRSGSGVRSNGNEWLEGPDLLGLGALGALGDLELDALVLVEAA